VSLALLLGGCATVTKALPAPPSHPNGQALWRIIHDQCLPDEREHENPAPCTVVALKDGQAHGYVVLKDRTGIAQHLLMPTAKITGIEDPALLAPDAVNYFARAWDERRFVELRLGRPLARTQVSITVNSAYGRSQDQLHLHIDCVDAAVAAILRGVHLARSSGWSGERITLKGRPYRVRWLAADELAKTNPFSLLAHTIPGARSDMGAWTLALVGAEGEDGRPGFYLLSDRADPATGDPGSAEDLQDHSCASVLNG
jgi:CDP-diacylglycerol pyrophosphatase